MKTKRVYIYEDTYIRITKWAFKEYKVSNTRSPNGKPLHKNFPAALIAYMRMIRP